MIGLKSPIAENIMKVRPSIALCKTKNFSATSWFQRLDMTLSFPLGAIFITGVI
jgi:hypothetical protein